MRAVSSVLGAAGLNKIKDPFGPEDVVMLKALIDVNKPKFLSQDIPLFENILVDLFPTTAKPVPD